MYITEMTSRKAMTVAGFGYIAYLGYDHMIDRRERETGIMQPWSETRVAVYKSLPLRYSSRALGALFHMYLPESIRGTVLGAYAWKFGVDLNDAVVEDLNAYESLGDLFRRRLKTSARPISATDLVSPADGRLFACGRVRDDEMIEQVKGVDYKLTEFLGTDALAERKKKKNTVLHYCVIYLAPGDYHGYHSPADWSVQRRRHFHGEMLSVREKIVRHVPRLFCLNERVALLGRWTHGFMSMTPVAATNVGQIAIDDEVVFSTNDGRRTLGEHDNVTYSKSIEHRRGDRVGEFRMGSSVVLIFDAPENFKFTAKTGDKLQYGQALGVVEGSKLMGVW